MTGLLRARTPVAALTPPPHPQAPYYSPLLAQTHLQMKEDLAQPPPPSVGIYKRFHDQWLIFCSFIEQMTIIFI